MPRNDQGTYSLPSGTIVNSGDTILPSQHNPAMQDIAQSLTNSLSRDGNGGMRADLPMGGFRATNMAPGVNPTDAATVAQASGGSPVGAVMDFAGASAPSGWVLCYGQALSRSVYSELFAVIGTTYGAGDGSTTFNVPDARGRVGAGKDDMGGTAAGRITSAIMPGTTLGATGGAETHQLTVAQLPAHNHPVTDPGHSHSYTRQNPGPGTISDGSGSLFSNGTTSTGSSTTGVTIGNRGSDEPHNNVQPTIIFNKIIRTGVV